MKRIFMKQILYLNISLLFIILLSTFAFAQNKGYGCVKHKIAVFGSGRCPQDGELLEKIENWVGICPNAQHPPVALVTPKESKNCPICEKKLITAFVYYSCPGRSDEYSFNKDSLTCENKKERYVRLPYWCLNCKIWFSESKDTKYKEQFKCPICGKTLLQDDDEENTTERSEREKYFKSK